MEEETKPSSKEEPKKKSLVSKSNIIFVVALILLIAAGFAYKSKTKNVLSQDAVKTKVENYIKDNLIQPGTDFQITKVEKEGSLYQLTLSVGKQEITAYVTNDGKNFFPQTIDLDKKIDAPADSQASKAATEASVKKAIPEVELFVMSYCPYGVQIEKGILPVIQKLGVKINFKLNFVDYTLHGKKEFDENLTQYCIEKQQPAKLVSYLDCFTKSSDSAKCIVSTGIIKAQIDACVKKTDSDNQLSQNFKSDPGSSPFGLAAADNKKYGVQGSPTLVINGTTIGSGRDSASLLKAVCSGFDKQPAECSVALSATAPSAGFGEGTAAAGSSSASCGN